MLIKEISERLIVAKRPIDFFGDLSPEEIKKEYRRLAKILHPDSGTFSNEQEKSIATDAFSLLSKLCKSALQEIKNGIYNIKDNSKLYDSMNPLFELKIEDECYKFYEHYEGEIAHLYRGKHDKENVYLKTAIDSNDNTLISDEYDVLSSLKHISLPIVEKKFILNDDSIAFIMKEVEGLNVLELLNEYSNIPGEHVMWMLERMLSVVGYLHSNCIIHGNIKPENIIINPDIHNVSLIGFSLCIPKANVDNTKYKIINEFYTAPEINGKTKILPNSDIYSIGKIAIQLLGGNIENDGIPLNVESEVRSFIKKLVNKNPNLRANDAWQLWDEVKGLRNKVYGTERFKKLIKRK